MCKSTSASGAPDNSSLSHFSATTRPSWLGRAVRNRHRHAIEQASRRWRGGRRVESARTRRKILISTQAPGGSPSARSCATRCARRSCAPGPRPCATSRPRSTRAPVPKPKCCGASAESWPPRRRHDASSMAAPDSLIDLRIGEPALHAKKT